MRKGIFIWSGLEVSRLPKARPATSIPLRPLHQDVQDSQRVEPAQQEDPPGVNFTNQSTVSKKLDRFTNQFN